MRLGIISDTHGLLRPEVFHALDGVEHILHAGDIGDPEILTELKSIAPVSAVWGNTDGWDVRHQVSEAVQLEIGGRQIVVTHGHQFGSPSPDALAAAYPEADLVVFGHTHRPLIRRVGTVLAVNPGSAGPRRFSLPVTIAVAEPDNGGVLQARLVELISSHG